MNLSKNSEMEMAIKILNKSVGDARIWCTLWLDASPCAEELVAAVSKITVAAVLLKLVTIFTSFF